jgi:hypothetical protein
MRPRPPPRSRDAGSGLRSRPVSFRLVTDQGAPADPNADPTLDPNADPTPSRRPRPTGPIQYKGEELDAQRGPGLGCFRFQLIVLVVLIVLTPLSVVWRWPDAVSAALLFVVILLLLLTGQTIIFLLRLVAADRRGRRRPLASATRTVGELEDTVAAEAAATGDVAATTDHDDPRTDVELPGDERQERVPRDDGAAPGGGGPPRDQPHQ